MEFSLMAIAAGCVTCMVIVALRVDHAEMMEKLRQRREKRNVEQD